MRRKRPSKRRPSVDKSALFLGEPKRVRDDKYRKWLSKLPCVITGRLDVQVAHIRVENLGGTGLKPCDTCCLPLACSEHQKQHSMSEREFWGERLTLAQSLAKDLYQIYLTGTREEAVYRIFRFQRGF